MKSPRYKQLYRLGREVDQQLPANARQISFTEIARELGTTKQSARNLYLLALGKLTHRLRQAIES